MLLLIHSRSLQRLARQIFHSKCTRKQVTCFQHFVTRFQSNGGGNEPPKSYKKEIVFVVSSFLAWIIIVKLQDSMRKRDNPAENEQMLKQLARQVSWRAFVDEMLSKGEVEKITSVQGENLVYVHLHKGAVLANQDPTKIRPNSYQIFRLEVPNAGIFEEKLRQAENQLGIPFNDRVTVHYIRPQDDPKTFQSLTTLLVMGLVFAGMSVLFKQQKKGNTGSMFTNMFQGIRKAKYKIVDSNFQVSENLKVKFSDVLGLHEAKLEIQEFVEYLKVPEKYTRLGAKLPKGALLLGPPGCGKTLLAKAVSSEANVPFLATNGAEFVEMIGGLGAARVRDLFSEAKRRAPCMIYIDEIDAIGKKRSSLSMGGGGHSEMEHTLNQLLVEMDGMDSTKGVIVIASTNRADILDKALLRRGRFDRHIDIDLPTLAEREEIFEYYLKKIKLEMPVSHFVQRLAKLTPGFTGADINNVCNEAAIKAATEMEKSVKEKHIFQSLDRLLTGPEKRSTTISPEEKKVVAYHESGHALVGWLLEHTNVLLKVTIVPRTSAALGFAQYNPQDKKLHSEDELFDRMCMALGGRAAENLIFASPTSGAQNDLEKVTRLAYDQVRVYGMSRSIGPLSFAPSPDAAAFQKPFGQKLAALFDLEANSIVRRAYKKAESVLTENRDMLDKLATELLKRETLTYEDVVQLIGPPRFAGSKKKTESVDLELPSPVEGPEESKETPAERPNRRSEDNDDDDDDNESDRQDDRRRFVKLIA